MNEPELDPLHYRVALLIRAERRNQLRKWGVQHHPNGTGTGLAGVVAEQWKRVCDAQNARDEDDWATIAAEEFFEVLAEKDDENLLIEVVQAAAVFTAWAEDLLSKINN